MKRLTITILITLITGFAFGLTPNCKDSEQVESEQDIILYTFDDIYFKVANDPELSKIEDWEVSILNIWNCAQKEDVEYIEWQTIKELLENPTELF